MAAPKKVDYERIEPGWRAGVLSPAQLAAEYTEATGISCSAAAVRKHFTKLGIPRDLTAQVRAKADALVLEAGVAAKRPPPDPGQRPITPATAAVVEQAALDSAAIQLAHRADIRRGREVVSKLQADLEVIAEHQDVAAVLAEAAKARGDDTETSRMARVANVVESLTRSIGARANTSARLIEALKGLIPLERQAWKIDDGGTGDGTYEERLRRLYEGGTA
jgi:hypothetical protein